MKKAAIALPPSWAHFAEGIWLDGISQPSGLAAPAELGRIRVQETLFQILLGLGEMKHQMLIRAMDGL